MAGIDGCRDAMEALFDLFRMDHHTAIENIEAYTESIIENMVKFILFTNQKDLMTMRKNAERLGIKSDKDWKPI